MPLAARQNATNATSVSTRASRSVEHAGRGRRREHEHVLDPLLRACGAQQRRDDRRPRLRGRGPFRRDGHRSQGTGGPCPRRSRRGGRGRSPRQSCRDAGRCTRAPATTGPRRSCSAAGSTRTRPDRRVRRRRRSGLRARARPRRVRRGLGARRPARPPAARAVRRGAELATAPENRAKLSRRHDPRHRRHGGGARADHRRRDRPASTRRRSSCSRARTASPPRSTSPAPSCAAPSASRSRPPQAGWLDGCQVVPYLNRLADLSTLSRAGRKATFRPARTT